MVVQSLKPRHTRKNEMSVEGTMMASIAKRTGRCHGAAG
jgi:hypothetical protein